MLPIEIFCFGTLLFSAFGTFTPLSYLSLEQTGGHACTVFSVSLVLLLHYCGTSGIFPSSTSKVAAVPIVLLWSVLVWSVQPPERIQCFLNMGLNLAQVLGPTPTFHSPPYHHPQFHPPQNAHPHLWVGWAWPVSSSLPKVCCCGFWVLPSRVVASPCTSEAFHWGGANVYYGMELAKAQGIVKIVPLYSLYCSETCPSQIFPLPNHYQNSHNLPLLHFPLHSVCLIIWHLLVVTAIQFLTLLANIGSIIKKQAPLYYEQKIKLINIVLQIHG